MKVRQDCFTGAWKEEQTGDLSAEKMTNMITMYDSFIGPEANT